MPNPESSVSPQRDTELLLNKPGLRAELYPPMAAPEATRVTAGWHSAGRMRER
jgi:hypothetical protein